MCVSVCEVYKYKLLKSFSVAHVCIFRTDFLEFPNLSGSSSLKKTESQFFSKC